MPKCQTRRTNAILAGGVQEAIGTIRNDDSVIAVTQEGHTSAESYPGKTLVWSDEFNGNAIDLENWTYDLGASGWGNQELQNYTSNSDNAYVANGNLMIVAKEQGISYTSARLKSIGLQEFQYGRIDVRAVLPFGLSCCEGGIDELGREIGSSPERDCDLAISL